MEEATKRVLIAVPTYENITPETFKSIYDIKSEHELSFNFIKGYDCARARNNIARQALDGGFDYVLMVDSDMIVPPDIVDKFLEWPVPAVVGVCPRKNTKIHETELFKFTERNYSDRFKYEELTTDRMQIKGSGFACGMIDVELFRKLPFPWFKYVVYQDGSVLSEDLYFCELLRQNNIPIVADTRVRCGHMARYFQYE